VEKSDNENLDALLAFAQGLEAEDQGDVSLAKQCYEKALAINQDFIRAQQKLETINASLPK
jgi:hypothetical protein